MRGFFSHNEFFRSDSESKWPFDISCSAKRWFRRMREKTADRNIELGVTLEEFYTGTTKRLRYKRKIICNRCRGRGSDDGTSPKICEMCEGKGRLLKLIKSRNNVQIIQNICPKCQGSGEYIINQCEQCDGTGVIKVVDTVDIKIDKGMPSTEVLFFKNKSDEEPGAETGDLHVSFKEIPHNFFQRFGDNLKITKRISIGSAISPARFEVTHLDGHKVICETSKPIKPGEYRKVIGQGMPHRDSPFTFGDLFIYFDVLFPVYRKLPQELINIIRSGIKEEPEGEVCVGRPCKLNEFYEDINISQNDSLNSQSTDCSIA